MATEVGLPVVVVLAIIEALVDLATVEVDLVIAEVDLATVEVDLVTVGEVLASVDPVTGLVEVEDDGNFRLIYGHPSNKSPIADIWYLQIQPTAALIC